MNCSVNQYRDKFKKLLFGHLWQANLLLMQAGLVGLEASKTLRRLADDKQKTLSPGHGWINGWAHICSLDILDAINSSMLWLHLSGLIKNKDDGASRIHTHRHTHSCRCNQIITQFLFGS